MATAETFRSSPVEPLSRISPVSLSASNFNIGTSPPIVPNHQQPIISEAIRELERKPGVKRMELIKVCKGVKNEKKRKFKNKLR